MGLILRLVVVVGLAVDAYVHFHLAGDVSSDGTLSEANLFLIQGAVAAVIAVLVLVRPRRVPYLIAFLVAASAFGAVMIYRYVDLGGIGPVPDMYEPVWYTEKVITAVAEGVAALGAAAGVWYASTAARTRGRRRAASSV